MHEAQPSSDRAWARTRGTWRVSAPTPECAGAVSTVRVKLVGATPETGALPSTRRFDKTQSYGRVLPSCEDCIAIDNAVDEERNVYMDVTGLFDREDARDQALAFAQTLPAVTPPPGLAVPGARARERLSLWLEPRDRVPAEYASPVQTDASPTLRLSAMRRTWGAWDRQPGFIVFSATAAICVLSLLAVRLLLS